VVAEAEEAVVCAHVDQVGALVVRVGPPRRPIPGVLVATSQSVLETTAWCCWMEANVAASAAAVRGGAVGVWWRSAIAGGGDGGSGVGGGAARW